MISEPVPLSPAVFRQAALHHFQIFRQAALHHFQIFRHVALHHFQIFRHVALHHFQIFRHVAFTLATGVIFDVILLNSSFPFCS